MAGPFIEVIINNRQKSLEYELYLKQEAAFDLRDVINHVFVVLQASLNKGKVTLEMPVGARAPFGTNTSP